MSSDNAKKREAARIPTLEWLREFDSQLANIDSRLSPPPRAAFSPRREATRRPRLRPGKILVIRYRLPRLPWPFRRRERREHPLTTVRLRA